MFKRIILVIFIISLFAAPSFATVKEVSFRCDSCECQMIKIYDDSDEVLTCDMDETHTIDTASISLVSIVEQDNLSDISIGKRTFPAGASSCYFNFPCETNSVFLATPNVSMTPRILSVMPTQRNIILITLESASTRSFPISLFTIINK